MKFVTSGDIHRMFLAEDKDTMITRNNVRRICLQNDINHLISANIILIDKEDFLTKTNPYKIKQHIYSVPKLRCIRGCAKEWNSHRKKGERFIHADEIRAYLKNDNKVFKYLYGNKWIVNYDQLEHHLKILSKTESPYLSKIKKNDHLNGGQVGVGMRNRTSN